jgi:hypothetical protein
MKALRLVFMLALFVLSTLLFVQPSYADNDGCYCTSRGYIAFEVRSFYNRKLAPPTTHVLKIFKFESGRGIFEAGEVSMEDFQVHEMTCNKERVEILGFGKGYVKYIIDITAESKNLHIREHVQDANRRFDPAKEGPAPEQLGLSGPAVIPLDSSDPQHKYHLVRSFSSKQVKDRIETIRKAELLQIGSGEKVSQRVSIFEDRYIDSAGE